MPKEEEERLPARNNNSNEWKITTDVGVGAAATTALPRLVKKKNSKNCVWK